MGLAGWFTHAHAFNWYWPYLGKVPRYVQDQGFWTMAKIPGQPTQREMWDCTEYSPGFVGYAFGYNEYLTLSYGPRMQANLRDLSSTPYMFDQDAQMRHGGINALYPDGSAGFYPADEGIPYLSEILD